MIYISQLSVRSRACCALAALIVASCGGTSEPPAITIVKELASGPGQLVNDDRFTYLSTADGVFRVAGNLDPASTLRAIDAGPCTAVTTPGSPRRPARLVVSGAALYLVNPQPEGFAEGRPGEHALCVSTDHGERFSAIDQRLRICYLGWCTYLSGEQLMIAPEGLYFNAGGAPNLLVTTDQGGSWSAILGRVDGMICYEQSFAIVGRRLLVGGECPLDSAYLRAYRLREDRLSLLSNDPEPIAVPAMDNRNVQFIHAIPSSTLVFAGVEGGLLRSTDAGERFAFALRHEPSGRVPRYAYVRHLAASRRQHEVMLAGGFDKARGKPWLASSSDRGANWNDISSRLPRFTEPTQGTLSEVTFISAQADGDFLIGVSLDDGKRGYVARVPASGLDERQ